MSSYHLHTTWYVIRSSFLCGGAHKKYSSRPPAVVTAKNKNGTLIVYRAHAVRGVFYSEAANQHKHIYTHFVACRSHLTIDHASLSRRSSAGGVTYLYLFEVLGVESYRGVCQTIRRQDSSFCDVHRHYQYCCCVDCGSYPSFVLVCEYRHYSAQRHTMNN